MLLALYKCADVLIACISSGGVRSAFNKEGWVIPQNDVSSLISTLVHSYTAHLIHFIAARSYFPEHNMAAF